MIWFSAEDTKARSPACNTFFAAVCPMILPRARPTGIRRRVSGIVIRLVALARSASSRTFPRPVACFVADGAHFRQGLWSRQGRRARHRRSLWLWTLWRTKPYWLPMTRGWWGGEGGKQLSARSHGSRDSDCSAGCRRWCHGRCDGR